MNIIIAINDLYVEPAKNMLFSLGYHHKDRICVYLLYSKLSAAKRQELSEYLVTCCHAELKCIFVDGALFAGAPTQKWWTEEMYYRLLAFEFLPKDLERALWLDADIVINGSFKSFYEQAFDGAYAVVCKGCNQALKSHLGLPDEHIYFNSGVILYNLHKIRNDFTAQQVFNCIEAYKDKLHAPDQDVLNILFSGKLKYADETVYNNETFGNFVLDKEKINTLHRQSVIIHFNGSVKPWHPKGANWADDLWWKYELKRGRIWPFVRYRLLNCPVKVYYFAREYYYKAKAIVKKVLKLVKRKD